MDTMWIDTQRIDHAYRVVCSTPVRDAALTARVRNLRERSMLTEFFSEQDVLTIERVELSEMFSGARQ